MSSYVRTTLINDEKVIYDASVSIWTFLPRLFIFLILLTGAGLAIPKLTQYEAVVVVGLIFLGGLIFSLTTFVEYTSTELAFTNKRVIAKTGLIARRTVEMNNAKVESVQVSQGVFGRIFNYGEVTISGAGNPQVPIRGISDPLEFRRLLMEHLDQVRAS